MKPLHHFRQDDSGAALVEFAVVLPMLILLFAMAVEGGRTFWAYQTTVAGLRDAARQLSRMADPQDCSASAVNKYNATLADILRKTSNGKAIFAPTIRIENVAATLLSCGSAGYRGKAAIAKVSANLAFDYPFKSLFQIVGLQVADLKTSISTQARILG
jgi:Flp pilus assembly protein TadG